MHTCEGQRWLAKSHFSPSTLWVLEMELQLSGGTNCSYLLSHLLALVPFSSTLVSSAENSIDGMRNKCQDSCKIHENSAKRSGIGAAVRKLPWPTSLIPLYALPSLALGSHTCSLTSCPPGF